jgi:hypothetical protein
MCKQLPGGPRVLVDTDIVALSFSKHLILKDIKRLSHFYDSELPSMLEGKALSPYPGAFRATGRSPLIAYHT